MNVYPLRGLVKGARAYARGFGTQRAMRKANLNKLVGGAALGLALLAAAAPSWAGFVNKPYTVIGFDSTTGRNTAYGSLRGARYSADTVQRIGCYVSYLAMGPALPRLVARCDAKDSTGRIFACITSEPEHIGAVQSMTDSAQIYLEGTPTGPGTVDRCNVVQIYDSSMLLR